EDATLINDQWLDHCREEGRFLAPEAYPVKDRTGEKQHKFSLSKCYEQTCLPVLRRFCGITLFKGCNSYCRVKR
ncbi:hypothetical protein GBAR_LOCUS9800, partial [Geodia barretti]